MPRKIEFHKPTAAPTADRSEAAKARKRFYDRAAWQRARAYKLARFPLCELCRKDGRAVAAAHVHHLRTIEEAPHLRLNQSNLQSLCAQCHATTHATDRHRKNRREGG